MKKNKIIKLVIGLSVIPLLLILLIFWYIDSMKPVSFEPDILYGKELSEIYRNISLKQFTCNSMCLDEEKNEVDIYFMLKARPNIALSFNNYSPDNCIKDITIIREKTKEYLKNNPQNELNNQKIHFIFYTYADMAMHMYNYDYNSGEAEKNAYDFLYFTYLEADDISVLGGLSDAKKIVLYTVSSISKEDLSVFDNFNNLELINWGNELSDEMYDYLKEKHPKCEIFRKRNDEKHI